MRVGVPACRASMVLVGMILVTSVEGQAFAQPSEGEARETFSLGFGSGIIYGGVGIKGEIVPIPGISIMGAAGFSTHDTSDWRGISGAGAVGLLYALKSPIMKLRPRLGACYGENQWRDAQTPLGPVTFGEYGTSLIAGLSAHLSRSVTLDADLLYAFRSNKTIDADKHSSAFQIAIGFKYIWTSSSDGDMALEATPY